MKKKRNFKEKLYISAMREYIPGEAANCFKIQGQIHLYISFKETD